MQSSTAVRLYNPQRDRFFPIQPCLDEYQPSAILKAHTGGNNKRSRLTSTINLNRLTFTIIGIDNLNRLHLITINLVRIQFVVIGLPWLYAALSSTSNLVAA